MARLIGMDEAGLGPNLGPFVVAATVWDVPQSPHKFDFWQSFEKVLTNAPGPKESRLHIADSKQVFQPPKSGGSSNRGIAGLERGVLSALRMLGHEPRSFAELCDWLKPSNHLADDPDMQPPWNDDHSLELPVMSHEFQIVEEWQECCRRLDVRLVAIKAAIVEPRRFNRLISEYDNKSLVVSRVAFQLLKSIWDPDEAETFVVADKHGGRNRYDQLLSEVLDQQMIFRIQEGAERSDYRVGKTLLRFQPRAEEHGPVALASMTAKYVRELAMTLFNRFWARHVEGLQPTQGYPVDAKRFRKQISEVQTKLAIHDDDLWRQR